MRNSDPGTLLASARDIVPNDNTEFASTRGVYIGTTGNLRVQMTNGAVVTFIAIDAGCIHNLSIIQVLATGTTATNIIGLF